VARFDLDVRLFGDHEGITHSSLKIVLQSTPILSVVAAITSKCIQKPYIVSEMVSVMCHNYLSRLCAALIQLVSLQCLAKFPTPVRDSTRSYALSNLGNIEIYAGNLNRVMELFRQSLEIKQQNDDQWAASYTFEGCAAIAIERQCCALAARLIGKASEIRQRLGTPLEPIKRSEDDALVNLIRNEMTSEDFEAATQVGAQLSFMEAIREAVSAVI
jgi:hypothetical protein